MTESEYLLIKNHEKIRLAQNLLDDVHPSYGVNITTMKAARLALGEVRDQIDDAIEGRLDDD